MKKNKTYNGIIICLSIIAATLFIGVTLFAVYLYKIKIITLFDLRVIFYENNKFSWSTFWTAIGASGTIFVGVLSIVISKLLYNLQDSDFKSRTTPHIMLKRISIRNPVNILTAKSKNEYKSIEDFPYPYFTNIKESFEDFNNLSMLTLDIINTSPSFCNICLCNITIYNNNATIAEFNGSTFGYPNMSLILCENEIGKIGLIVSQNSLEKLKHCEIKITLILNTNEKKQFKDTNVYCIISHCDDAVMIAPKKDKANSFVEL